MNTGNYITPETILFNASVNSGDMGYKAFNKGFYMTLIQDAFEELNMTSFFAEERADFDFPMDNLTLALPKGCINVMNIYIYSGSECNPNNSRKIWWKRNYYTKGGPGYIANDKGRNMMDPFLENHFTVSNTDKSLIRYDAADSVNQTLYYNIQMGNIMFSSSCRSAGNKIHIHYRGVGGDVTEAPIIPRYYKQAIEDFVTEGILRVRMANEPSNIKFLQPLWMMYNNKLDKNGMNGSWFNAVQMVRDMNTSQSSELAEYLQKMASSRGL